MNFAGKNCKFASLSKIPLMKILHTSDWHLGKRLETFSRLEEQREVLSEISEIAVREKVDAVVIAGDLFDTFNPPTEAIDLFYQALKKLADNGNRPVIAVAGNHDSPDRIEAPNPLARECGILFAGYPNSLVSPFELDSGFKVIQSDEGFVELQLPRTKERLRLLLTPYSNEYRLKTFLGHEDSELELRTLLSNRWSEQAERYCDREGVNILVTHLFMVKEGGEIPEEPEEEKPILHVGGAQAIYSKNVPKQIQYVALGHLHRKQIIDQDRCKIVYSGSPLSYSFAEADQKKYVVIIEVQPGESAKIMEIELKAGKKLLRKRAESLDEALVWLRANPDCLAELTLVTNDYLTAEDRKQLLNVHQGIVNIIPEIATSNGAEGKTKTAIDLSKGMEELFVQYFKSEKGQDPGENLLSLFKEVLAEEE
jgi:DNA repair protein SbcD/Mre11